MSKTLYITKLQKLYSSSIPQTYRNMGWNGTAVGYKMNVGGEYLMVEALTEDGQIKRKIGGDQEPKIRTKNEPFNKGSKSKIQYENLPEDVQERIVERINEDLRERRG